MIKLFLFLLCPKRKSEQPFSESSHGTRILEKLVLEQLW